MNIKGTLAAIVLLLPLLTTGQGIKNKKLNNQPDPSTLNKKVMFGYQGWHATPHDGSGNNVWRHWFNGNKANMDHANFDLWPDMKEYPATVQEESGLSYPDGSAAKLYSAYKYETVDVHFKWMKEHSLDGVFEQRFVGDIRQPDGRKHFTQVVRNVKAASEKYKRVYCIMYDISGAGPNWKETLMADWKYLVDSINIAQGSSYLHHKGRPLVTIWGLGFSHTAFASAAQVDSLLKWFHHDADKKYQATVMGGLNDDWLKHSGNWMAVYNKLDVISPWAVGRYNNNDGANRFKERAVMPDKAYCDLKHIDYMPVIFPGFSWYNMHHGSTPFNQIPRKGGNFFWRQSYNVITAGVNMVYIAMYDEVDEGTAMYKVSTSAATQPVHARFVSLDQDGYLLPSDWYLSLADATGRVLRKQLPNTPVIPNYLLNVRKTK